MPNSNIINQYSTYYRHNGINLDEHFKTLLQKYKE